VPLRVRRRQPPRPRFALSTIATQCSKLNSLELRPFVVCQNEKERTHSQTIKSRLLSHLWCRYRAALCASFRHSALRISPGAKVCRN
jgi:hypothetical protein